MMEMNMVSVWFNFQTFWDVKVVLTKIRRSARGGRAVAPAIRYCRWNEGALE